MQRKNYGGGQKHQHNAVGGGNMGCHVRAGSDQIIRRSAIKNALKNDYKS
jgi:hypothetical protein